MPQELTDLASESGHLVAGVSLPEPPSPEPASASLRARLFAQVSKVSRGVLVLVVLASLGLGLTIGHAAALSLNIPHLFAVKYPADIDIPEVLAFDHFQGSGGLDGSESPTGGTWEVISGGWQYEGSSAVQVQNNSPNALAVLDTGMNDHLVLEVGMGSFSSIPTARGAGIAFFASGTNLRMHALYNSRDDEVVLAKRANNGQITELATFAAGALTEATLRLEIDQPELRVYLDGALVITYQMTGGEISTYGSHTRHGITTIQDKDTTFDWFLVEALD